VPEIAAAASLADLGSGAGFPGFPIAILNPHLSVCLVESRLKRNHFQRLVRRSLDLPQVQPILGRSDEVEAIPVDVVIAQAMAQPMAALSLMRSWARPQGWLILPASENAPLPARVSGVRPFEERSYRVPESGVRRKLWITRREDD
jgi:16S rRNA (guanine527-N7)-methyltransferase